MRKQYYFRPSRQGYYAWDVDRLVILTKNSQHQLNKHLVRRPGGLDNMPEMGIFAQRAKDRPNSISVTAVKIVSIGKGFLEVSGLDAINGTPILDIKPYFPQFDLVKDARVDCESTPARPASWFSPWSIVQWPPRRISQQARDSTEEQECLARRCPNGLQKQAFTANVAKGTCTRKEDRSAARRINYHIILSVDSFRSAIRYTY